MPSSTVAAFNTLNAKLNAILANEENLMTALDDLKAAEVSIAAAIQTAITLIMTLKAAAPAGTADADVEAVVAQLNQAATDLNTATGTMPGP